MQKRTTPSCMTPLNLCTNDRITSLGSNERELHLTTSLWNSAIGPRNDNEYLPRMTILEETLLFNGSTERARGVDSVQESDKRLRKLEKTLIERKSKFRLHNFPIIN